MNCPHAGDCGGCSLLHLSYAEQVASKERTLRRLLTSATAGQSVLPTSSLFLPVASLGADPAHFRQKVAFVFGQSPSGRGLVMGHYRRASQEVVPVVDCPAHNDRGNAIAFALRDLLAAHGVSAAGPQLDGILRHLIVRTTADSREAVAMLVVTKNDKSLRKPVRTLLDSTTRPDGFFLNVNRTPGPFMVGDLTQKIDGRSHVRETVGGVSYLISPTAFFQTNVEAAAVLQDFVVRSAVGADRVLDLYCGSGLFSLPLAAGGIRVTGVEENPRAIADAETNARLNRIAAGRARFITSRVEHAVRSLRRERWDLVVLDPPRHGCSDEVLETVFQNMAPARAIYVSCNPESLVAELPGILRCGYRIEEIRAVDMFPHTEHLEVVVRLRRT